MIGFILAALVSLFMVTTTFFLLWSVGQARTGIFDKSLTVVQCFVALFGLLSTWIWTIRWRTLRFDGPPWRFVVGPRPSHPVELSAWRWGRRAWVSWFVALVCVLLSAFAFRSS